jgi:predicted RNA binding protein YcfA (HicA-like mRNA interferase family)
MPKLPSSRQIIKVLEQNGFIFISQRGSHAKYRKSSATVIVPCPKKEIPLGTFRSIVRQSGLAHKDFLN